MENSNDNKALKAGVWYIICNFFVKGATFLTTPLFTRLLSQDDIGQFSNIVAWVSIFTVVTTFDLYASITLAKFDYADDLDTYVSSILVLGTGIAAVSYVVFLFVKEWAVDFFSIDERTLHIIFAYMLVYPALQIFQIKSRMYYKYKLSVFFTILTFFLSSFTSLVCVLVSKDKLQGRITGFYIPLIVFNVILYLVLFCKSPHIRIKYWKYSLAISIPLIFHTLAGNLLGSCDRIIITRVCGATDNALYSIAYTCATPASVLWSSMNTAWAPWAYEQMDSRAYDRLKEYSKPYTIVFVVIVVGFMLISPELLYLIGGALYQKAIYVIPPIMIGFICQFVYSFYVNVEFYEKKQSLIALGTGLAALLNIVLNHIFVPLYGYVAAAYTTMIGYLFLCIFHSIIVRFIKKSSYYDNRFFSVVLGGSFVIGFLMNIIYKTTALRICLLCIGVVALVAVLVFLRKEIGDSIKTKSLAPILNCVITKRGKEI